VTSPDEARAHLADWHKARECDFVLHGGQEDAFVAAQLAERYEAHLRDFLLHGQEDALAASYALGREAIEIGLGVLDLCAIHEAAARSVAAAPGVHERVGGERAFAFLSEGLAPFEMVHRGFREANDSIHRLNAELEDRVRDLGSLAAIVETSYDAIVGRKLDGTVTTWNVGAERLFGYTADEMIGQSVEILVPPELEHEPAWIRERLSRGERIASFESLRVRKDGTLIEVESAITPIMDPSGAIVAVSAIARDVSERRRAQEQLERSERRYRELIENATDLIVTVDLDGRLTSVNAAFERALGYTRDELLGRPIVELVPPGSRKRVRKIYNVDTGPSAAGIALEHQLLAEDGRVVDVEVVSHVVEEGGRAIGVQAICRDTSERKALEEQLARAQRLESVGRLAGGIAHDFNNLLTVIGGSAQLLLADLAESPPPELSDILEATKRAEALTRQLLVFSRQQVLEPRVVDLNDVARQIVPILTRLIGEDIDLDVSYDPTLTLVLADPSQLEQVLVNLVVNARDAMPTGGKLTIETTNAELDEEYVATHPGTHVGFHAMLAVSDNGSGMDAETLAHVFEPFFTTKPVGTGTGLGLATVYGVVRQSGGSVEVYTELERGTTFKIYLPAATGRVQPELAAPSGETDEAGNEVILVVEDDEAVRELAARMLERGGFRVLTAGDGDSAALTAAEHRSEIRAILTDLVLTGKSGIELAGELAALVPEVRVLFMSGYSGQAAIRHADLPPGAAYVEKPFSSHALVQAVRLALDNRPPYASSDSGSESLLEARPPSS
jgi:two-component system cell cycle sensor histidine kinase/response regulator CckA